MTSGESVDDRISKTNSSACKKRRPIVQYSFDCSTVQSARPAVINTSA